MVVRSADPGMIQQRTEKCRWRRSQTVKEPEVGFMADTYLVREGEGGGKGEEGEEGEEQVCGRLRRLGGEEGEEEEERV